MSRKKIKSTEIDNTDYINMLYSAYQNTKSHYYGSKETNSEAQYANWLRSLFEP